MIMLKFQVISLFELMLRREEVLEFSKARPWLYFHLISIYLRVEIDKSCQMQCSLIIYRVNEKVMSSV